MRLNDVPYGEPLLVPTMGRESRSPLQHLKHAHELIEAYPRLSLGASASALTAAITSCRESMNGNFVPPAVDEEFCDDYGHALDGPMHLRDALFAELRSAARLFVGGDLSEMSPLYVRACEDRLDILAAHVRACAAELDAYERPHPKRSRS